MDTTIFVLLVVTVAHTVTLSSTPCSQECCCSKTEAECSRRQLPVIPDGIPESILRLDLSDNQITDVYAAKLSRLHSLDTFYLQMNHLILETVPADLKHFLSNLKSIRLSDNPWHRDGGLAGHRNWIQESPEVFADARIACASPGHLKGKAIQNVSIQELTMAFPTQPTHFWSHSLEVNLNITTIFYEIMNQIETTSLGDVTQLLQPSSTASIIQVTKSEDANITPLLQAPDSTTNLEVTTSPAYHGDNFSREHHQVLDPFATSGYHQTHDISSINTMTRELNQQPHPSTELPLMPGKATPALQLPTLNAKSSAAYTCTDNQVSINSLPHEAPSTSSLYTSAHIPRKIPPSSASLIISTTTINPHVTSSCTSTFTARPTSVANVIPLSSSLTDATEDVNGDRQPHQTSAAGTPPQGSLSSTLATSFVTLPTSQLDISTSKPPVTKTPALNKVPLLAPRTFIQPSIATTEKNRQEQ